MSTRGADGDDIEWRENSHDRPDGTWETRTSKKRKVLSCYACRNRKMKCDRIYPVCGRCQKTGRGDQCTYDPRLLEESNTNTNAGDTSFAPHKSHVSEPDQVHAGVSPDELRWKVRVQDRKIEMLEQKLAAKQNKTFTSHFEDQAPEEPELKEEMMFQGRGFKTQFHGASSLMSLIAQFRELQAFTREALMVDHSIIHVKTNFRTFRERRKTDLKHAGATVQGGDDEIFKVLPGRNVTDTEVALYFQTWETTYRILHQSSFWTEYATFWELGPVRSGKVSFAVMLVLIVAFSRCLTPKDDVFLGDTTADRQAASHLIEVCDAWINRQPRKRLTLSFFQLQCLSVLAKRANCIKLKQDWIASGDLIRLALAAGMHRNPSLLARSEISAFEMEMKKRLWVTIMELELQSSIESGLQSSLTSLHFDTPAPSNLPDDAFSAESHEMPASRPIASFTSASYQIIALKSLPLRILLTHVLNDPSSDLHYSDVLHYDAQIHAMLSSIPSWEDDRAIMPVALLQLQLRQFLLIMHKPYANLATQNNRYTNSFIASVDAASSMIGIYDNLVTKGLIALNNIRNDVARIGLALSQILYHNCTQHGPVRLTSPPIRNSHVNQFAESQPHLAERRFANGQSPRETKLMLTMFPQTPFLAKTLCTASAEILERARLLFEQKVLRLGTGYMEFWLLSAAVGMLPSVTSPAPSTAFVANVQDAMLSRCRTPLDRFATLTLRILALQKDPGNSFAVSIRDTMARAAPTQSINGASGAAVAMGRTPVMAGMSSVLTGGVTGPAAKDETSVFDALQDMQIDMAGWSFPDFWAFDLEGEYSSWAAG